MAILKSGRLFSQICFSEQSEKLFPLLKIILDLLPSEWVKISV